MKTKSIPAVVMLTAGLIACIAGIAAHMEVVRYTKMLLAVLVVFYILGCAAKIVIDKSFKEKKEETTDGEDVGTEDEEIPADEVEQEEKR